MHKIKNRKGTFQILTKEGCQKVLCDQHLNIEVFICLDTFRGAQDILFVNAILMMSLICWVIKSLNTLRAIDRI